MGGFRRGIEEISIGPIEWTGGVRMGASVVDEFTPYHLGSIIDDTEISGRISFPRVDRVRPAGTSSPFLESQSPAGSSIRFESDRRSGDRMILAPGMCAILLPGVASADPLRGRD